MKRSGKKRTWDEEEKRIGKEEEERREEGVVKKEWERRGALSLLSAVWFFKNGIFYHYMFQLSLLAVFVPRI